MEGRGGGGVAGCGVTGGGGESGGGVAGGGEGGGGVAGGLGVKSTNCSVKAPESPTPHSASAPKAP